LKILVLSFYYEPDLCAGSFRTTALVNELVQVMAAGSHIDVVSTLPNRYSTFSTEAASVESRPGVSIKRIALPQHKSGMVDQTKAFVVFSRQVLQYTASRKYDIIFATSSRLMTAVLGAWIAHQKKVALYLDIRDIFVDTIKDVLPRRFAVIARPVFSLLEKYAIRRAGKVNLVSRGFREYFFRRYPQQRFSYYTNGIDENFIAASATTSYLPQKNIFPVSVLYAGNIGEGQGLHAILPDLAKRMRGRVRFIIIGDGGRKEALRLELDRNSIDNVELLEPINRERLIDAYIDADVLFLHLHDYDAFKKVLPSKIFEYAAMGKPIWAGVAGYAAEFMHTEIDNSVVFHPCDAVDAERVFSDLSLQSLPREKFVTQYARRKIMKEMALDILLYAKGSEST